MSETKAQSPPPPWEVRVRQVLRKEMKIEDALKLPAADRTEGYDPEVFRADLKLLDNLNDVYMKTKSWRLVEFGMSILGGPKRILHLDPGFDWEMYAAAAENEGRLITPVELRGLMDSDSLLDEEMMAELGPSKTEEPEPPSPDAEPKNVEAITTVPAVVFASKGPASIDDGEHQLSTKTVVLGRSFGYPYRAICDLEKRIMDAKEYCEYVAQKELGLEVRRECHLQLCMELQTIDELLARLERNRDEETRTAFVKEVLEKATKYHLVKGQRLYSRAYVETYPAEFPLEDINRFSTKLKCEGDCLACNNFVYTLVKPGPSYIKY